MPGCGASGHWPYVQTFLQRGKFIAQAGNPNIYGVTVSVAPSPVSRVV
jgi:hypothetical protein